MRVEMSSLWQTKSQPLSRLQLVLLERDENTMTDELISGALVNLVESATATLEGIALDFPPAMGYHSRRPFYDTCSRSRLTSV